jgi:hypothetical protein
VLSLGLQSRSTDDVLLRAALLVVLLAGCPTTPLPDAGLDTPAPDHDAWIDAATDTPPASPFCQPCRRDADCGEGAFCTVFLDGSWACSVSCASESDCAGVSLPSTCAAEAPGLPLGCRPTAGSCVVSTPGGACGAGCSGTYDVCHAPAAGPSYCTTACITDADCPMGLRRCVTTDAARVCVRDEASPPERCEALLLEAPLPSCGAARSCAAGSTCLGTSEPHCFPLATGESCALGVVRDVGGTSVCVPDGNAAREPSPRVADCECLLDDGGLFDEAVALTGRDRCGLRFAHSLLDRFPPEISHDVMRLSFTDDVHSYWPAAPQFGEEVAATLDAAPDPSVLLELARYADLRVERPVAPAPVSDAALHLLALVDAAGGTPNRAMTEAAIEAAIGTLSDARGDALARLFAALVLALEAREAALASYAPLDRAFLFDAPSGLFLPGLSFGAPTHLLLGALRGDVDVGRMASASLEVLGAAREVQARFAELGSAGVGAISIATPRGAIVIGSPLDDRYEGPAYASTLLVLELGGNDTYRAPVGATATVDNGVSVLIDLGGVDDYGYLEVAHPGDVGPAGHVRFPSDGRGRGAASSSAGPFSLSTSSRQGAGRLGIGLLLDLGAEGDHYRSLRMSQGYGALGVGVLYDAGGDDLYEGEAGVQGAAVAGVGLLMDGGGTDRYVTYHASQGFAYTRGVGALYDASGDDTYFAHPSDVLYFSPQSPGMSNSSFVQGVAFGRRDDAGGLYMSGGLGILRDRAGHDRYTCGIFCQASGYWYGTGLLLEGAGDDHYDGEWYVQAGDAHFAVAVLLDDGGDDVFNETAIRRNAGLGGGHDFSSAWLIDRDGDDLHRGPGLSFGTGHAGGFGAFLDLGGTDTYDATGDLSFGDASIETPGDPARQMAGSVGIFLERGGTDAYARPTPSPLANDATWTQAAHTGENETGAGLDRETGAIGGGLD